MQINQFNKNFTSNHYRLERKYLLFSGEDWKFKEYLASNEFRKSFPARFVNTIYFDTENFNFLDDNIQGISKRIKVRARWYDKNFNINLELKKKYNMNVWKPTLSLGKFESLNQFVEFLLVNKNIEKISNIVGVSIFPVLMIKYLRDYWLSYCKKYRATLDTNMQVSKFYSNNFFEKVLKIDASVLEFKYSCKEDKDFRNKIINNKFPFRYKKFSKYSIGSLALRSAGFL